MNFQSIVLSILLSILAFTPLTSNAIPVGAGDILRVDFDLSMETPPPPYEGIYTTLGFGAEDYLNIGEGFSIALFDDGGEGLADGTGYFVIYDIVGTFELSYAQAAGRFYDGGMVSDTTAYIDGSISTMLALPDLGSSLADPFSYTNTVSNNVSWFGHDRHFISGVPVPEPTSLILLALVLLCLGLLKDKVLR